MNEEIKKDTPTELDSKETKTVENASKLSDVAASTEETKAAESAENGEPKAKTEEPKVVTEEKPPVVEKKEKPAEIVEANLEGMNLLALFGEVQATLLNTPHKASRRLTEIRPLFFQAFQDDKKTALDKHIADEKDPEEFVFEHEALADNFGEIQKQIKAAVEDEKKRIEEVKQKNLKRKKALLAKLEEIVSNDETLESIKEVKEIQAEWKTIRVIAKEEIAPLWDKYNFLQDKFYDNHSINIELKEFDRKKNLSAKIELTKKTEALLEEKSIKKALTMLNKYHEEYKAIGSIPSESREAIWNAFKTASDSVYASKREEIEKLEEGKAENLKLKELLVEKAKTYAEVKPKSSKEWNALGTKLDAVFVEWKKIGPVPKSNKDEVWKQFNGIRNDYYTG